MVDQPFVTWAFRTKKSDGSDAPTSRTMPDRIADSVNVMEYGALGNGSHDDRPNIQAAFDDAFGSASSPHADTNAFLNRTVIIPHGQYVIGAPGLLLTRVKGGRIIGAGRGGTQLLGSGATAILKSNGLVNCHIEGLDINGAMSCTEAIDIDWDGTSWNGGVGLDGNSFVGLLVGNVTDAGLRIGVSGHGGTNNVLYTCHFGGCLNGVEIAGDQALNNSMFGGQSSACTNGIKVTRGQLSALFGTAFQVNSGWDVLTTATSANAPMLLQSSRTESTQHAFLAAPVLATLESVSQQNAPCTLAECHGIAMISGCWSGKDLATAGIVSIRDSAIVTIQNSYFNANPFLDMPAGSITSSCNVELEAVHYGGLPTGGVHITKQRRFLGAGVITVQNYNVS